MAYFIVVVISWAIWTSHKPVNDYQRIGAVIVIVLLVGQSWVDAICSALRDRRAGRDGER